MERLKKRLRHFLKFSAAAALLLTHAQLSPASMPLTLAVRIVGLEDPSGKTTLNPASARKLISEVNSVYADSGCSIRFRLDSFETMQPARRGLAYRTRTMAELEKYREAFDDRKSLLIVDTGPWDPSMHPANAWTAMPGQPWMGSIFESRVADFHPIVAHELGHYLGLNHVDDRSDMMNPVIDPHSTRITPEQCHEMKVTATTRLTASLR